MSEPMKNENEANVNENNEAQRQPDVDATRMKGHVENGKFVYDKEPKGPGFGTKLKIGLCKAGAWIKRHPIATLLIVGGTVGAGEGASKLYNYAYDKGHREGVADEKAAEEQRKLEEAEQQKLLDEAEQLNGVPEVEDIQPVENELGEVVG